MRLNKLNKTVLSFMLMLSFSSFSQQDEQSSLYMFNPLQFNPAYAGSRGDLSVTAIVRSQWVGIDGAPQSQFVSMNSPFKDENKAYGLHFSNDIIGAKKRTSFYGDYAYTLHFQNGSKLNLGASFGGDQLSVDYQKLVAYDPTELDYLTSFAQLNFNVGAGAYFYSEKFYAGLSAPRLFETSLKDHATVLSNSFTKRHYFLTGGYVKKINSVIDLKTSFLLKMAENAPVTVDLNTNLFFHKKFWIGGVYRFNESVGVNLAYQIKESFMFGYAFGYPINGLSRVNNMGSHEVMLSFSFNKKNVSSSAKYF